MPSTKPKICTPGASLPKPATPQPPNPSGGPSPAAVRGFQKGSSEAEPPDTVEAAVEEEFSLACDEVAATSETKTPAANDSKREPLDPVKICARMMVCDLVRRERRALKSARLVVITVPASWLTEISRAWVIENKKARALAAFRNHYCLMGRSKRSTTIIDDRVDFTTEFEQALLEGRLVVGISADPVRTLPRGLTAAPDCLRLRIPSPDAELLSRVAVRLTHRQLATTTAIPDLGRPTPEVLRMACRRGQSPEAWLKLVATLAAGDAASTDGPSLDQMSGLDEVKAWAKSLGRSLQAYVAGRIAWKDVDRGVLLVGPPGVGKTTVARAIARYCGVKFIATSYAQWQGTGAGHLGNVQQAMDGAFLEACEQKPCILFIDEIDAIHLRNGGSRNSDWWHTIIASLLEWLDGSRDREGVIVIAATNYLDEVDEGLRRSGRLDRVIEIGYPDAAALVGILRYYLGGDLPDVDLRPVAERLEAVQATGADVERAVRGARARAREEERTIEAKDLLAALANAPPPPSEALRWRVAVHEAGHALVDFLQAPGSIRKITVTKQGRSGWIAVASNREPLTRAGVGAALCALLAGRAAEKVILGDASSGAGGSPTSDLAKATALACNAVAAYGLGHDDDTLVWRGPPGEATLSGPQMVEVRHMLVEADRCASALIRTHRPAVETVARQLLEAGELDGAEVEALFRKAIDVGASPPATT